MTERTGLSVDITSFGTTKAGQETQLFTLRNANGMQVSVSNYGGIITEILVPDRDGVLANTVVGYNQVTDYEQDPFYLGALVGRYANRIAAGRFEVNGQVIELEINNGPNHLHGASHGFNKVVWTAEPVSTDTDVGVQLTHISPDGEGGYPGELTVVAEYRLSHDNKLTLSMRANTTALTPVSLTQHSYFNLAGGGTALAHELWLNASHMTPVNENIIPTGERLPVVGTPFDFNQFTAVGKRIGDNHEQLALAGGYDHNFAMDAYQVLTKQAELRDPLSGRVMTLYTDAPGMQLYSVNLDSAVLTASGDVLMEPRGAICLEPQQFPDAPNQGDFPSPWLQPTDTFSTRFVYEFSTY